MSKQPSKAKTARKTAVKPPSKPVIVNMYPVFPSPELGLYCAKMRALNRVLNQAETEPLFYAYSQAGDLVPQGIKKKVVKALNDAAPGFPIGAGPLDFLAWLLWKHLERKSLGKRLYWQDVEQGHPVIRKRRERLITLTQALQDELSLSDPTDSVPIKQNISTLLEAAQNLNATAQHELKQIYVPKSAAEVWHTLAGWFCDLMIQAWIEGGTDFYKGKNSNFGLGATGRVTKAVTALLKGIDKNLSAHAVSDVLEAHRKDSGDPPPWPLPWALSWPTPWPVGRDFLAFYAGERMFNEDKRRENQEITEADLKTPENTTNKEDE